VQAQGSGLINQSYFNNMIAAVNAAPSCSALNALTTQIMASINAELEALNAQNASLAALGALNPMSITNLGAAVNAIRMMLVPYQSAYATYLAQFAATTAAIAQLQAAITAASARFASCSVTLPPVRSTLSTTTNPPAATVSTTAPGVVGSSASLNGTILSFGSPILDTGIDSIIQVASGCMTFQLQNMNVSSSARVRFYGTAAAAAADRLRPNTIDPVGNHGMYVDMMFTAGYLSWITTPPVLCSNQDSPQASLLYAIVQNLGSLPVAITVNSSILIME
jgi:hypothetical protein